MRLTAAVAIANEEPVVRERFKHAAEILHQQRALFEDEVTEVHRHDRVDARRFDFEHIRFKHGDARRDRFGQLCAMTMFAPENHGTVEVDANRMIARASTRPFGAGLCGAAKIFAKRRCKSSALALPHHVDEVALRFNLLHREFIELMAIAIFRRAPHARSACLLGRVECCFLRRRTR